LSIRLGLIAAYILGMRPNDTTLATGILSPVTDIVIRPGQSVFFSGQLPVDASADYRYSWTFGGAAPSSDVLTPRDVFFRLPGQYVIDFGITDSQDNVVGQTDSRIVTVLESTGVAPEITPIIVSPTDNTQVNGGERFVLMAALKRSLTIPQVGLLSYQWKIKQPSVNLPIFTSSQLNPEPYVFNESGRYYVSLRVSKTDSLGKLTLISVATSRVMVTQIVGPGTTFGPITYPTEHTNVTLGDIIAFQSATISEATNLSYEWDFEENALPSTLPTPPPVIFNQIGTFMVSLRIKGIDIGGLPFNWFGQRAIYVNAAGSTVPFPPQPQPAPTPIPPLPPLVGNTAPESIINSPTGNISIQVGQSVVFAGRGFDPLGGSVLRYEWNFKGAVPNSIVQTPGLVAFNRPGSYSIDFVVINDNDVRDSTPANVLVTVTP